MLKHKVSILFILAFWILFTKPGFCQDNSPNLSTESLQLDDPGSPGADKHIPSDQSTLQISGDKSGYSVTEYLYYYVDKTATASFKTISDSSANHYFKRLGKTLYTASPSDNLLFFRFNVTNLSADENWYLFIDFAPFNKVSIFLSDPFGQTDTLIHCGMDLTTGSFLTDRSGIICRLPLKHGLTYTTWIRIESSAYVHLPVTLNSSQEMFLTILKKSRYLYSLLSLITITLLINLLLFIQTRARSYLLLAVTIFFFLISLMYQAGIDVLPAIDPYFKSRVRILAFSLMMVFFHFFTIIYLEIRKYPVLFSIIKGSILFYLLYTLLVLLPFIPPAVINTVTPYFNMLSLFVLLCISWFCVKRKQRFSSYFLIFNMGLLAGGLIWVFHLNNLIPHNLFSGMLSLLLTSTLLLLMSIAHSDSVTRLGEEKTKNMQVMDLNQQLTREARERTEIEHKLRKSEDKFRLLFNMLPQPVVLTDMSTGIIEDVNTSLLEVTGYSKDELIGTSAIEINLIEPGERESIVAELSQTGEIRGRELTFRSPKFGVMQVLVYSKTLDIEGKNKLLTLLFNITKLKQAQNEIKKLSIAIEKSAHTVIITNNKVEIEYVNTYFTELTGYSSDEVTGKNPSLLSSGYHTARFYKNLYKTLKTGEVWQGEFLNRKKNGDLYWENASITPIRDDEGAISHFIGIKQDITEQKRQIEAIKESEIKLRELNASKDKFFSIIGHDLMDPFNALYGFSNMIIESIQNEDKEESLEYAHIIRQSANNILTLLQNLLTWSRTQSRQQSFNPVPNDLGVILADTMVFMLPKAQAKNIRMEMINDDELTTHCDSNMIGTVLRNLISNAIKFTHQGGKIVLRIKKVSDYHIVSVADNGQGIEEKYFSQLFRLDKTFTSRGTDSESGTGLGLVICKEFIDLHQGKIWIDSKPGEGTTVSFRLPNPEKG
jgi:PAS domain S-box-containing protein